MASAARLEALAAVCLWCGSALLLSVVPRLGRLGIAERLRPYSSRHRYAGAGLAHGATAIELSGRTGRHAGADRAGRGGAPGLSLRELLAPLARRLGSEVSRVFRTGDDLATRLERAHAGIGPTTFRLRQLGWAVLALFAGLVAAVGTRLPALIGLGVVLGAPLLAYLVLEQRSLTASRIWQERVFLELPVVAEQLAMLLAAGYSLGSAITRIAARGEGACAADWSRVVSRMRQGLSETEALQEWSALAQVPAVTRLVMVVCAGAGATELSSSVSGEARLARREAQRKVVQVMDRRAQEVWVPVTVAALLPGVLFLAVPFFQALKAFAGA
ncbi:MAG: type II secretion system F family protein [Acidimicrobiales bacterium]